MSLTVEPELKMEVGREVSREKTHTGNPPNGLSTNRLFIILSLANCTVFYLLPRVCFWKFYKYLSEILLLSKPER